MQQQSGVLSDSRTMGISAPFVVADVVIADMEAVSRSSPCQPISPDGSCAQSKPQVSVGSDLEAKGRYFIPKSRTKAVLMEDELLQLKSENEELRCQIKRLEISNEMLKTGLFAILIRIFFNCHV
jgi:hypothetical protein